MTRARSTQGVFISFNQSDRELALQLRSHLADSGVTAWCSAADVIGGEDWDKQVVDALSAAAMVVLLLSEESAASKYVRDEIAMAWAMRLPILPCRTGPVQPRGGMRMHLARQRGLRLFPGAPSDHFDEIVQRVEAILGG